jgi:primosomal protein N' (replication factor Y)
MNQLILKIAIATPIRKLFDYLAVDNQSDKYPVGSRVEVPFGKSSKIGIIVATAHHSDLPLSKLRGIKAILDDKPLLPTTLFNLLLWSSDYYHHPLGEVISSALPKTLREGKPARLADIKHWRLTEYGRTSDPQALNKAPKQQRIIQLLQPLNTRITTATIAFSIENPNDALKRLEHKGLIEQVLFQQKIQPGPSINPPDYSLNQQQIQAIETIASHSDGFKTFLLDGITGSGKTEVYLQTIASVLSKQQQVLILVPEIGLTPQLLTRFKQRFQVPVALLHSGLADGERFYNWMMAKEGFAPIVIGTRSAVFTPLLSPGLIVVDEEHDTSLKQQDGFRYSARDIAVKRAQMEQIPIILGSATPSLESLSRAYEGHYQHCHLTQRVAEAKPSTIELLDIRQHYSEDGLAQILIKQIEQQLFADNQVLLFLNRRGFAPVILCYQCHWIANCKRCDAKLTYYHHKRLMRCHHCGSEYSLPKTCPSCQSTELHPVGEGTERLEASLAMQFPTREIIRIDSDTTRNRYAFEEVLQKIEHGKGQILIGTQLIAKGHHFPNVTLVIVVNADGSLFSIDFRASERMAQQIIQVAGRAGRAHKPGRVIIQTAAPDHPFWHHLQHGDYHAFVEKALQERKQSEMPPFSHLALIRAESHQREDAHQFLSEASALAQPLMDPSIFVFGPVASPMERRAGRYRAQLMIQSSHRAPLHHFIQAWLPQVDKLKMARKVRWSLDVDPVELY